MELSSFMQNLPIFIYFIFNVQLCNNVHLKQVSTNFFIFTMKNRTGFLNFFIKCWRSYVRIFNFLPQMKTDREKEDKHKNIILL